MKKEFKFLLLFILSAVVFTGCKKDPVANFTVSSENVYVGETVTLINISVNALSINWEITDPIGWNHYYNDDVVTLSFSESGTYKVNLTAYGKKSENTRTKYINVKENTNSGSNSGTGNGTGNGSGNSSGSGSGSGGGTNTEYTTFTVTNNHGYPYSITQIRNGVTVETYSIAANATKTIQSKCGTTEKFTIRQTSGYFEYPNTINVNPTLIDCSHTYNFTIRCSDSYIVCTNYDNSNQYYVDITCPDNGTNNRMVIDGYSKDSLMVDAGFSYTVKFTQKNGYVFSPSTKTYTVDADCGYIYTRSAPDNMKGNDAGNSDVRLPDAANGKMEIYE